MTESLLDNSGHVATLTLNRPALTMSRVPIPVSLS